MNTPHISVIVAVYNVQKTLRQCLESLVNQTLKEIEIICVNDGSTDLSNEIIAEYAEKDCRVKMIDLGRNCGTSVARKQGVMAASGKYIMFCDSDDEYYPNACEVVWREMEKDPVDILHFASKICAFPNAKVDLKGLKKVLQPVLQKVEGDLCKKCLQEEKWGFTLWNKAYNAEICKKAFGHVCNEYIVVSEDLYVTFLILYFSKTYRGISSRLYLYRAGEGITVWNSQVDFEKFKKLCTETKLIPCIKQFLDSVNAEKKYYTVYKKLCNRILENRIYQWMHILSAEDSWKGYQLLTEKLTVPAVVGELERVSCGKFDEVVKRLTANNTMVRGGRPVKRIGAYYHRIRNGGAEKITTELLFIWKQLGYEVSLITDEPEAADDYPVPEGTKRIVIRDFRKSLNGTFAKRAKEWKYIIEKNNLDTIVYHDATSPTLLWDLCSVKGEHCNFFVVAHSMFAGITWYDPERATLMPDVYKMVDGVAVLSDTDAKFWSNYCPAYYIPNPISLTAPETVSTLKSKNILWVGRLSPEKQPEDMIKIFSLVKRQVPDATLTMLGSADIDWMEDNLQQMVDDMRLSDSVEFVDFTLDVERYYQEAAVFAFTSKCESFSMVLAESKNYGLPIVMYSLPNLELIKDGKGVYEISQNNVVKFSNTLISLLQDEVLRREEGAKSRESIEEFVKNDICERWGEAFQKLSVPLQYGDQSMTLVLDLLLSGLHEGILKLRGQQFYSSAGIAVHGEACGRHEEVLNRHEEVVNRHEEVVNRHEEVVNRHEEVVNRHEDAINHQWGIQKWHEDRISALEQRTFKGMLKKVFRKLFKK